MKVTRLGMGCEQVRDPELIVRAVRAGINHFHWLHQLHPGNADIVARALKSVRAQLILACGWNSLTTKDLLTQLDVQLDALKTDRIDLWYLTSRNKPEDLNDASLEAARIAKKAGKIRACAISTHNLDAIFTRLLEVRSAVDAVMVTCNFAVWAGATEVPRPRGAALPAPGFLREHTIKLHDAGFGVIAMKPLLGALKFVPPERRKWAGSLADDAARRKALAAALRWTLNNRYVDSAPVQMASSEELEANIQAAKQPVSEADRNALASELKRISPHYCRMCNTCLGACRQELPVADILRFLMYARGYGNEKRARQEFQALPRKLQEVRCDRCPACTVSCPYGVRVREEVALAQVALA